MRLSSIFCIALLFAALAAWPARADARYVSFPGDGFKLQLPDRWIKVPADVFEQKMQELKKAFGKSKKRLAYRHALQLGSKDWFSYPYMLISLWEDNRVETDEIPDMNERLKEHLLKEGDGIKGTRLRRSSYSPDKRLYQAELAFEMADRRMVLIKGVCYLHRSVLVFNAYIPEKSYEDYAPDINSALDSLQLDPARVYRAEASKGLDFKKDILPYLKISIATGIILLLAGLFLWKRRRDSDSSS